MWICRCRTTERAVLGIVLEDLILNGDAYFEIPEMFQLCFFGCGFWRHVVILVMLLDDDG